MAVPKDQNKAREYRQKLRLLVTGKKNPTEKQTCKVLKVKQ